MQLHPEIYCDLNGRVSERGYSLELRGSVDAFDKLGLSLERAVGERFTFYMDDENERGERGDLMFDGIVVNDPRWGYIALADDDGFYRRSARSS